MPAPMVQGFNGFWQINLQDAPFRLPPPLLAIGMDGQEWSFTRSQRVMGLWSLPLKQWGSR